MSSFLLPDLGEGLEEAQLVSWLVKEGDTVALNQPICQVETAKALVDIPSPFSGTVTALHAQPGETVPVGAPLLTIEEQGAASSSTQAPATRAAPNTTIADDDHANGTDHGPVLVGYGSEGPAQTFTRRRRPAHAATAAAFSSPQAVTPVAPPPPAPAPAARPASLPPAPAPAPLSGEPRATPLVRKLARERGLDLRTVQGSGPNGRIRLEDLESLPARPAAHAVSTATATHMAEDEERISTVGLRKAIAARMMRAATTIPHFTEYGLFDATALTTLRAQLKNDAAFAEHHLTFLPFFVRALVRAVQAYPIMNAEWDEAGNAIVVKRRISVGIATDTERGLLVPVIHDAHSLSFEEITARASTLITLARSGKIDAPSLTGGTITITNVGAAGPVETGAPIINPPEVCIVGFGAIKPRPTAIGNHVLVRPGAWISISCDHRVVDGATAAQFLGALVRELEEPEHLVG